MLSRIGNAVLMPEPPRPLHAENLYQRNEIEDMKKALEYLYEFKKKLNELHPACIAHIEQMMQRPRF